MSVLLSMVPWSSSEAMNDYVPRGTVHRSSSGDTLKVSYDLLIPKQNLGEVKLSLSQWYIPESDKVDPTVLERTIYSDALFQDQSLPSDDTLTVDSYLRLKGKLKFGVPFANSLNGYYIKSIFREPVTDTILNRILEDEEHGYSFPPYIRRMSIIFGLTSFEKTGFEPGLRGKSSGIIQEFQFVIAISKRRMRYTASTVANYYWGKNNPISFNRYIDFDVRYSPFGSRTWLPGFSLGSSYSRLKSVGETANYLKTALGIHAGASIINTFEEIGYEYSSEFGGYHVGRLRLFLFSSDDRALGTEYSIISGDDFRMYTIKIVITGDMMKEKGDRRELEYVNRRPLPHKILAGVAAGPFWLLGEVVGLFHDE